MRKLFGTDGVRGVANAELTSELAFKLGKAGAYVLSKNTNQENKKEKINIIVGTDGRISGDMLESALTAGMCSVGANVYFVGTIPTPAIAYLVRKYNMNAGVMISASHNIMSDNGIKFFNNKGFKLSDEIEKEIEDIIAEGLEDLPMPTGFDVGRRKYIETSNEDYMEMLANTINVDSLAGIKIAIDCANGATSYIAKTLFEKLGAKTFVIHNEPNGTNINANCGSTHMGSLIDFVKQNDVDVAFAFDGDGDRCLAVDGDGNVVDGDQLMAVLASHMKECGTLKNNTLVATVMSNLGLKIYGKKENIEIATANVGDRYVLEYMLENNCNLGGEQSGHIILLDHNTTGDGLLSAVQVLAIMKKTGKSFNELNSNVEILPQVLINAKVSNKLKYDYMKFEDISNAINELEKKFNGEGRVLVRPSGTEPLVRVMIEGKNKNELEIEAKRLASIIEEIMY